MRRATATWAGIMVATTIASLVACGGESDGTAASPGVPTPPAAATDPPHAYVFESGPVRPLALSADGKQLFVANTPAGTLDILAVENTGLRFVSTVSVGVDPVAVAVRDSGEVWVVNHLSDSVSIVDVSSSPPRVRQTLLVGDEPRDIVFAGPGRERAFITTAHRGQQRDSAALAAVPGAGDPRFSTPGTGRADVWVFDANRLGTALGGRPLAILSFRGDTPRALAATPDGKTVYVAVHHSGNRTTSISSHLPCEGFDIDTPCTVSGNHVPGSALGPATNHAGVPAPRVGLIVKADADGAWRDARGRDWSDVVRFQLPDEDVFTFDSEKLTTTSTFSRLGTTLFNMAVNPRSGVVYVSNTEARNELRFEGPGRFSGSTLQGHLAETRITVLNNGSVNRRHLNKHIAYDQRPATPGTGQHSLSTPLDMAVSSDGATLYVAAFGSGKVGAFPTAALEDDSFDPTQLSAAYLPVTGGGPSGLALDETRNRLYVTTRFDNGVSAIDLATRQEITHLRLGNPESRAIIEGRKFLYDARLSSSNGEAACASCHVFGNTDHLAWDLGDPDAEVVRTPATIKLELVALGTRGSSVNGTGEVAGLHPMKGPMGTQTLRGMANHGAMHWRGDRVDGFFGKDMAVSPPFDAELSFKNFITSFEALLGRAGPFPTEDMQSFSDFALAIAPPPNPVRNLDNSLNAAQARGRRYFMGCDGLDSRTGEPAVCGVDGRPIGSGHLSVSVGSALPILPLSINGLTPFTCEGCHRLSPADGFFGTNGQLAFVTLPQTLKIPQLRNLYDKVGKFGVAANPRTNDGDNADQGAQVRGFGFSHNASVDTLFRFLQLRVFDSMQGGRIGFAGGDAQRRDVEAFLLAFDSDLAPIVGQQITLDGSNAEVVGPRIDLLRARAAAPYASKLVGPDATECDLMVRGVVNGRATRFVMRRDGSYGRDDGAPAITDEALRALAIQRGQQMTFTCLPPGRAPKL